MAKKIENDALFDEENAKASAPAQQNTNGKKKVVVVNVPKRKKLLRTPSHIIRITLIWCFLLVLFLLTYPFLEVRFYITKDLSVSPYAEDAYRVLAEQEDIDKAAEKLQKALDSLVEVPKTEDHISAESEQKPESAAESSAAVPQTSETSDHISANTETSAQPGRIRDMDTVNYNWTYTIKEGIQEEKLTTLIDQVKKINRYEYTEDSIKALNTAVLEAQKILCASVFISQNALQMMVGGTIAEAFGSTLSVGNAILRSVLSFALAILPIVGIFACVFDKKRIVKNIIVMIVSILALIDIFTTIYPFIGIGAVLSIVMYVIISLINIFGFYARQQEKYIVEHPEKEAEYTEKHPYFVRALINEKTLNGTLASSRKEKEFEAAVNAKKRNSKKKKGK